MGDQLYMDMQETNEEMKKFWALEKPKKAIEPFTPSLEKELKKLYYFKYLYTFSRPNFNDAMGNMICIFIWDDHEIFDGFGSYSVEIQKLPVY
jgi:phosphodiesterase/alkaline phosphatase D-like protein